MRSNARMTGAKRSEPEGPMRSRQDADAFDALRRAFKRRCRAVQATFQHGSSGAGRARPQRRFFGLYAGQA